MLSGARIAAILLLSICCCCCLLVYWVRFFADGPDIVKVKIKNDYPFEIRAKIGELEPVAIAPGGTGEFDSYRPQTVRLKVTSQSMKPLFDGPVDCMKLPLNRFAGEKWLILPQDIKR